MRSMFQTTGLIAIVLMAFAASSTCAEEVTIPASPAGGLVNWLVELSESPSEMLIDDNLGETLNDGARPNTDQIMQDFRRIKQLTDGFVVVKIKEIDALELDVLLRGANGKSWWIATIGTTPTVPHKVTTLRMAPLVEAPTSGFREWGDITWSLGIHDLPSKLSIRAERVDPTRTKPFIRLGEDRRTAIASASMLFPIAHFANNAAEDRAYLDIPVRMKTELVGLVGEEAPKFQPGDKRTAEEVLSLAMSPGLTSADQLIAWLGRANIERYVFDIQGEDSPNFPFLMQNEFFKLKLLEDGPLYRKYADSLSEDERRLVLSDLARQPMPKIEQAEEIFAPTRVKEVEWRASADELCKMLDDIQTAMEADESGRLRAALNELSPQNQEMGVWHFVFHVSGGEPGVFADAYLLQRLDGVWFRFAVTAEDPFEEIDFSYFGGMSNSIITLMAIEP